MMKSSKERTVKRDKLRLKGKESERKVKQFKYLGYMMQRNDGQEKHIRKVDHTGNKKMWDRKKKIRRWLEKRLRKRNCKLFISLGNVIPFGAEIQKWKKKKEIENVQKKYIRQTLGLKEGTPEYLIRDAIKKKKI